MESLPSADPAPKTSPPAKRVWPWKKILLWAAGGAGGLILLVVLVGPSVIGAVIGSRIEEELEDRFGRKARVGNASFRWSGRVRLEDVEVERLLTVRKIDVDVGLRAALGGRYRARVEVRGLRAVVERDVEGRFGFETQPDPASSGRGHDDRPPPFVQATLDLRDAQVVVRGGGRESVFTDVVLSGAVDTLAKPLAWRLSAKDPSGGTIEAGGVMAADRLHGRLTAAFDGLSMENLSGLARAAANDGTIDLRGRLTAGIDYAVDGPQLEGTASLQVTPFTARIGTAPVDLEALTFRHEARGERHSLTLRAGRLLGLSAASRIEDLRRERRASTELSIDVDFAELARLAGRPEFSASGAASLRGTIETQGPLDEDIGGQLRIPVKWDLRSRGTATAIRWGDRQVRLEGFTHASRGEIDAQGDGRARLEMASGEAVRLTMEAALRNVFGTPEGDVTLSGSSELRDLGPVLAGWFGFRPGMTFEGRSTLSGKGRLGPDRLSAELEGAATGVTVVEKEGRRHPFEPLAFSFAAAWDRATRRATVEKLALASGVATVEGRGSVSTRPLSIGDSHLKLRLDLDKLGSQLAPLTESPPPLSGRATIDARAKGSSFEATVASDPIDASLGGELKDGRGTLRVQATIRPEKLSPRLGGAPLVVPLEAAIAPGEVRVTAKTAVERLTIDGRPYAARSIEVDWRFGREGLAGTTDLRGADLAGAKEESIRIVHELGPERRIRRIGIASDALKGSLTGDGATLRGGFTYIPDRMGAALSPWLRMKGAEEKAIAIQLENPAGGLRGARGTLDLDLAPTTHTGFTVAGKAHVRLEGGRATLSAPMSVNGGTADVRAVLDFRESSPQSAIEARMNDVAANAEMEPLLSKLSPIFHTLNGSVGGRMRSDLKLEWHGPLEGAVARTALRGQASLHVPDLSIVGSPALQMILSAMGEEGRLEGELSAPSVRVGEGKTHYKDLRLRLKRYELRFEGWVGFDQEMKLEVEMPLTEAMSKRYPNLEKYVGTTLVVPLEGTVKRPRLDLDRALRVYLQRAAEGLLEEKLRELLERRRKK